MEERNSMNEIVKLMHKIGRAMEMSREKQDNINKINNGLMEETRPMMVEKMKNELTLFEQDKKEFDDMTKNSLVNAKKDVLTLKQNTEKEFQEKLIETAKKQKELADKLKRIEIKLANERAKDLPDDKMQQVEAAAQKAIDATNNEINSISNEMKDFQNRHYTKRNKLIEFENNLQSYAIELGLENEFASVELEQMKSQESKEQTTIPNEIKSEATVVKGATEGTTVKEEADNNKEKTFGETNSRMVKSVTYNKPQTQNGPNKYDHKKVLSIEVKDNKYYVTYENKKDGVYNKAMTEIKKIGLFKNLSEKIKLISNRNEYGIDFKTALRADSNVLSILSDETLKDNYKEMYLKALEGTSTLPFEIKYNKDSRYARALQEGQKRLELKAGNARDEIRKNSDEKRRNEVREYYEKRFGESFYQREAISNMLKEIFHKENKDGENIAKTTTTDKDANQINIDNERQ